LAFHRRHVGVENAPQLQAPEQQIAAAEAATDA
jgi:hypothetical protein